MVALSAARCRRAWQRYLVVPVLLLALPMREIRSAASAAPDTCSKLAQSLSPGSGDQRRMSLRQTYATSRVGHALQGRNALGRRRVDESMPMRLKQVRIGRPAPNVGAAVQRSNLQPRDASRGACSPSHAFWAAPRAIVGLKRGGGGWCILASAMTERVVASSDANSRLASKPSTRGGVGRGTLYFTLTC